MADLDPYVPELEIGCELPPWFCSVCHREAEKLSGEVNGFGPSYRCCGQRWWPEPGLALSSPWRKPDASGWVGPWCCWCRGKHLGIDCVKRGG